ncbi:hypothetical protein LWM68_00995 [Niabella sp. W65]|nr:hypothetical protein [Niabella sp. W65]MCH7361482.1 hypothetical protein [Niabella sp. W65]ULT45279.1 hypothetical protein KRR40_19570 [Niabella sp. I65]
MREALFIKKNKDRWLKDEAEPPVSPDEMASAFTQTVDDLAYAKTFYANSKTANYLNKLAARMYLDIYRNRKEESSRLKTFWKYELPLTIRKHHSTLLFSFVLFTVFSCSAFSFRGRILKLPATFSGTVM